MASDLSLADPQPRGMKPSLVVFLHSYRYDRLYQAASLLLTASSMGWPCHLFLFYQALGSYMNGAWDEVNIATVPDETATAPTIPWLNDLAHGFEANKFPSIYEMIDKARGESGGLGVCACSTSCKVLGLDMSAVREKVDEIVGLPTMLQIAENARHVMYI